METLTVSTRLREEMINITQLLCRTVAERGWKDGVLTIFCPHTTCGITVNEGADPDVAGDITRFFHRRIPQNDNFRHYEGNADAHIKASIFGSSLQIIVEEGNILLGTWQAIWLFEGDGPRTRSIWLKWLGS